MGCGVSNAGEPIAPMPTGTSTAALLDAAGMGQLAQRLAADRATGAHQADPAAHQVARAADATAAALAARRAVDAALAAHDRSPTAHARPVVGFDAAPILAATYFA